MKGLFPCILAYAVLHISAFVAITYELPPWVWMLCEAIGISIMVWAIWHLR